MFIIALSVFAYDQGGAAGGRARGRDPRPAGFIAAPFAAGLGDRYRRELLLVILSFVRAGFMAAAALVLFAGGPELARLRAERRRRADGEHGAPDAVRAACPQLAKTPEELTAANLVLTTVESSGIFLGPALGGILLAATNTQTVFAAAAVAFVGASALLVGLKVEAAPEERSRAASSRVLRRLPGDRGRPELAADRGLYGVQTLVAGALNVLIVVAVARAARPRARRESAS